MTVPYFAGASGTHFRAGASSGTAWRDFSEPQQTGGVQQSTESPAVSGAASPPGLIDWLSSEAARSHAGRWVLLTDELQIVDVADSPGDLLERHSDRPSPVVVFVEPRGVEFAV